MSWGERKLNFSLRVARWVKFLSDTPSGVDNSMGDLDIETKLI